MIRPSQDELEALVRGEHPHPFRILGPQPAARNGSTVVRGFSPGAGEMELVTRVGVGPGSWRMRRVHPEGLFEVEVPEAASRDYLFRLKSPQGTLREQEDPYRFRQLLSDFDLYLLGEGTHYRSYEKLGAHLEVREGVRGTRFAVWAPNARSVSLVGSFNHWDPRLHPMERHDGTGIWQLFLPGVGAGELYKYRVRLAHGGEEEKVDPYGFFFETPPRTATLVWDLSTYEWGDQEWLRRRGESRPLEEPVAIYEVHLGSWRRTSENRFLNYRQLAQELVPYVKELGFTHLELLPVTEHPYSGSWGYQTTGYFAPTSRYGEPDDFRFFVDSCHRQGVGVILDWVPAHFPADRHALSCFDGTCLYEHEDPRLGYHPDWGTLIFNYGRNEVRNFLISSALFWLEQYHVDGLRVDAVASMLYLDYSRREGEWVPNRYGGNENLEAIEFLKRFNEVVHQYHPGILTIAEESTAWPGVTRPTYLGGLGFDLKWNMGWMHDSLQYMSLDPIHRKYHHDKLTFSMLYAFSENFVLPLSHDEVVHGKRSLIDKMPGDLWQKFANLRCYFAYMLGHPGKKHLFMGGELGQWREWNAESSLDWHLLDIEHHARLHRLVKDLYRLYREKSPLHQLDFSWEGFQWVDFQDAEASVISFLRKNREEDFLLFVFNFTPVPREGYCIGVPRPGLYEEILNTDSTHYGGSNVGNLGLVQAEEEPRHGFPHSLKLVLPPLGALILEPRFPGGG